MYNELADMQNTVKHDIRLILISIYQKKWNNPLDVCDWCDFGYEGNNRDFLEILKRALQN